MTKKVNTFIVVGTRPEAIKMAPVIKELKERNNEFTVWLCVTGQHQEMLYQVLEHFELIPDFDLRVMEENQTLTTLSSKILLGIQQQLILIKPDIVLVHGDTTTAMVTGLACFYASIPVAHIEAGLRTGNLKAPFPEEFNRRVLALSSKLHFAPTELAETNLLEEKISKDSITITGNTVIDALYWTIDKIETSDLKQKIVKFVDNELKIDWRNSTYVLITGHRRENFGQGFIEICNAIAELAMSFPNVHFIYPVHLNPNVKQPVYNILSKISNVHLISPLGYPEFSLLLKHSSIVLTDSGGIQEEAPSMGVPVLVMRDTTERPEAVDAGTVKLVSSSKRQIIDGVTTLLTDTDEYNKMAKAHNPYGDGKASARIADGLTDYFINEI